MPFSTFQIASANLLTLFLVDSCWLTLSSMSSMGWSLGIIYRFVIKMPHDISVLFSFDSAVTVCIIIITEHTNIIPPPPPHPPPPFFFFFFNIPYSDIKFYIILMFVFLNLQLTRLLLTILGLEEVCRLWKHSVRKEMMLNPNYQALSHPGQVFSSIFPPQVQAANCMLLCD